MKTKVVLKTNPGLPEHAGPGFVIVKIDSPAAEALLLQADVALQLGEIYGTGAVEVSWGDLPAADFGHPQSVRPETAERIRKAAEDDGYCVLSEIPADTEERLECATARITPDEVSWEGFWGTMSLRTSSIPMRVIAEIASQSTRRSRLDRSVTLILPPVCPYCEAQMGEPDAHYDPEGYSVADYDCPQCHALVVVKHVPPDGS